MIKINGAELPAPSDYQPAIQDISNAERNANGEMIIERIATKRKLSLSWAHLGNDDLAVVLSAVSPVFFTVEYPDPQTGALRTGTFYSGDRSAGGVSYSNGMMEWKDIKFDLIEK